MMKNLPQQLDEESLSQLPKEELVKIIIEEAIVIEKLEASIKELQQEIQRLKVGKNLDSKSSSKPPSSDLLKKSEKKESDNDEANANNPKRKPGGQLGHEGKTRKGFGRVDRYEILRPQVCMSCGQTSFETKPVKIEFQQVAQLVVHHRDFDRCPGY